MTGAVITYPADYDGRDRLITDGELYGSMCYERIGRDLVIHTRKNGVLVLPLDCVPEFAAELVEVAEVYAT